MNMIEELDPNEHVSLAIIVRTQLKHVKAIRELVTTVPNTRLAYSRVSLGVLIINAVDEKTEDKLEIDKEGNLTET